MNCLLRYEPHRNCGRQGPDRIELYRRALVQDYRQVEWRLDLARALAATDRLEEAIHEVRVCLRLRPQYAPAVQLMEELVKRIESIRD